MKKSIVLLLLLLTFIYDINVLSSNHNLRLVYDGSNNDFNNYNLYFYEFNVNDLEKVFNGLNVDIISVYVDKNDELKKVSFAGENLNEIKSSLLANYNDYKGYFIKKMYIYTSVKDIKILQSRVKII